MASGTDLSPLPGESPLGDLARLIAIDLRTQDITAELARHDARLTEHAGLAKRRHDQMLEVVQTIANARLEDRAVIDGIARHIEQSGHSHRRRLDSVSNEVADAAATAKKALFASTLRVGLVAASAVATWEIASRLLPLLKGLFP